MVKTTNKLEDLLQKGLEYFSKTSEEEISKKLTPEKWSKKEILGHLIDSGVNNLQRFTEIQFENKPYKIRKYNQNELVIANDYQNAKTKELLSFWIAINHRILNIMKLQTEESLNYKIELDIDNISDLHFLMTDYVDHLEHHLNQIIK
ncbi:MULTISPECIES: DinB family protein [unclassified Tenacibaculum]|uniref:DinB family protein n=1 Tax=unclassified Tenacibaculum TaxID=2635139 RepID=UPI001F2B3078|nr:MULTISPECIES: DinB family protein [unclassified Tenacibaculum]MCF2876436.1 DinB family protein [Tenacibaculum sp. Cn5-1]MCF2936421.1 DinB family protein [Tenacibaculum sp. Cn5-34]MCG7512854.1 DinB family protein [Tenacibaculum sp. Cn5-46]